MDHQQDTPSSGAEQRAKQGDEIEFLMSIRHKNLVSLVGYCEEGSHLAIIYEYMAGGNLLTLLSASHSLSWKERLQIAIDSAQGLDYLHSGCRPPIVHRDVKTPNILLNKNLQAKIADFGLSKIFPYENKSYVSTRVIASPALIKSRKARYGKLDYSHITMTMLPSHLHYILQHKLRKAGVLLLHSLDSRLFKDLSPKLDVYLFGVLVLDLVY